MTPGPVSRGGSEIFPVDVPVSPTSTSFLSCSGDRSSLPVTPPVPQAQPGPPSPGGGGVRTSSSLPRHGSWKLGGPYRPSPAGPGRPPGGRQAFEPPAPHAAPHPSCAGATGIEGRRRAAGPRVRARDHSRGQRGLRRLWRCTCAEPIRGLRNQAGPRP